ncbi:MAG: (2Fe-2S) ferredoxin domain-containing protein [Bacilli bacterium]|nr:(2Fe-2S) ferredoxin domain-containing protein [Bacilli bacterium]
MLSISVCVGSSCHLKGSYDVIDLFKKEIKARNLEEKVDLKAAFCLNQCSHEGVAIRVNDKVIAGVTKETFASIFEKEILPLL